MNKIDDGGPAHPTCLYAGEGKDLDMVGFTTGISLRDYFAHGAPLPSLVDIRDMLGWQKDMPLENKFPWREVGKETVPEFPTVRDTFEALPLAERIAALVQFNYLWADAMIAARKIKEGA